MSAIYYAWYDNGVWHEIQLEDYAITICRPGYLVEVWYKNEPIARERKQSLRAAKNFALHQVHLHCGRRPLQKRRPRKSGYKRTKAVPV